MMRPLRDRLLVERMPDVGHRVRDDGEVVTGGGIIPAEDMDALRARGIGQLFGPGTPTSDLITYITSWASEHLER